MRALILLALAGCAAFTMDRVPVGYTGHSKPTCDADSRWLIDLLAGAGGSYYFVQDVTDGNQSDTRKLLTAAELFLAIGTTASAIIGYGIEDQCSSAERLYARRQHAGELDEEREEYRRDLKRLEREKAEHLVVPADAGVDAAVIDGGE